MATKSELLKRIRLNCIECMGGQSSYIEGCTSLKCQFFKFRFGKDPDPVSEKMKEAGLRLARMRKNNPIAMKLTQNSNDNTSLSPQGVSA